jgi:hypothetical protein
MLPKMKLEIPITAWHEGSGFQRDKYLVIRCDRKDVEKIKTQSWHAMRDSLGNTVLYTNIGTDLDPVYLPLTNFIVGAQNSVFIGKIPGADPNDYRRKALRTK